jgi:hypothetical protein
LFSAIGDAERSNNMASYTMDQKVVLLEVFLGSCLVVYINNHLVSITIFITSFDVFNILA